MTVFFSNIRRIFKSKLNFLFMLVIPVLLTVVVIVGTTGGNVYKVAYIDKDDTKLTKIFRDELKSKKETIKLVKCDEKDIKNNLINNQFDCSIVINKGFTDDMIQGKDSQVDFYCLEGTNLAAPIKLTFDSFFNAVKTIGKTSKGDETAFYACMDQYVDKAIEMKDVKFGGKEQDTTRGSLSIGFFAMGLMLLMMSATTLIMKDKESNVFTRIATTPVSLRSYFLQNIMSFVVVSLIQIVVVLWILWKGYKINFSGKFPQLVCLSVLFAISCISIGIVISRYSKKSSHVNALVTLLTMPMLMLGGCLWPFEYMPSKLRVVGNFLPTRWYMQAATKVLEGKSLTTCVNQMLFLLAFATVMFVVAFIKRIDATE